MTLLKREPAFPWLWLSIVLVVAVAIAWYSAHLNNYAITPDFSGLACAADHLATEYRFSDYESGPYSFEMCWQKERYVALQLFHAALLVVLPVDVAPLLLVTIGLAYLSLITCMSVVTWKLTGSRMATFGTAIFTTLSPSVLRSLVLTPQNLFGYLLISVGLLLAVLLLNATERWHYVRFGVLAAAWLGLLGITHDLSFGIAAIAFSVWFVFVFIHSWIVKAATVLTGVGVVALDLTLGVLPVSIEGAWALLSSNSFPGFYHPIWDHPAIWGYIVTALGVLGLTYFSQYVHKDYRKTFWLLLFLGAVPLIVGHLPLLGLSLLPNRFIPFAWIPLAIGAGLAVQLMIDSSENKPWIMATVLPLLIVAQAVHGIVFIQDDINGLSFRYRPSDEFVEAVQWLDDANPTAHLFGVQSDTDQVILIAKQWYSGQITYYPWFALNHKRIKQFNVVNPSSPFSDLINDPSDPQYIRLFDMYTIITKRKSPEAQAAIQKYDFDYLLLNKKKQPYTELWKKNTEDEYPVVFENDQFIIYELR